MTAALLPDVDPATLGRLSKRELEEFIHSFDQAVTRLMVSYQELQRHAQTLRVELDQKTRELEAKNRLALIGEMAACLAHEIRNPLGGLQLYLDLIDQSDTEPPSTFRRQTLSRMRRIIDSVHQILDDMLHLSSDFTLTLSPEPLLSMMEEGLLPLLPKLEKQKIQLIRRFPEEEAGQKTILILADARYLVRVFANLFTNAVEAMPQGGQLTLEVHLTSTEAQIEIADTGRGIPEEVLQKLFTPFFTTKSKGIGLGLTLSKRIVEKHRGTLQALSVPGQKTTLRLHLPRWSGTRGV